MNQPIHAEPTTTDAPSWRAILIGIDNYSRMPANNLNGCVRDASAVRDFLVDKLEMQADHITFFTSPAKDPALVPTAANIRACFASLVADDSLKAGDHVVLFYACHGVRLTRANADASTQAFYGLVAADVEPSGEGFCNLILDREINQVLRQMTKRGVSVTVIADTCHSGAATRDLSAAAPTERYLKGIKPLSESEWQDFKKHHPALSGQAGTRDLSDGGSDARIGRDAAPAADFVVLAACQDGETAKELTEEVLAEDGTRVRQTHGALTSGLLRALRLIPAEQTKSLRWMDFYDDLSANVVKRVYAQRPALEGNPERPVFGGQWKPFSPGFVVRQVGGVYHVEGGIIQGLDVGAEIDIYPYDTANFEASATQPVRATIDSAALSVSTAKLLDPAAVVETKARARLVKPSPTQTPMKVRCKDVPEEILREAKLDVGEAPSFVTITAADTPAHVELRPFIGEIPAKVWGVENDGEETLTKNAKTFQGARDGWVLVRSDTDGVPSLLPADFEAKADDIIAYLPGKGPQLEAFSAEERRERLGLALGEGLVHYAKYLRTRDRSGVDETLRAMLSVKLRAGDAADIPDAQATSIADDVIAKTKVINPNDGIYTLREGDWSFLEVTVLKPTKLRLFVGLLLCCDEGNVIAQWPPAGENYTFDDKTTTYIGEDRFNPLFLSRRRDQERSLWTLKLIGYTAPPDSAPIDLRSLEQTQTVQDVFAERLKRERGFAGRPLPKAERPAWYTWNFRVSIVKP